MENIKDENDLHINFVTKVFNVAHNMGGRVELINRNDLFARDRQNAFLELYENVTEAAGDADRSRNNAGNDSSIEEEDASIQEQNEVPGSANAAPIFELFIDDEVPAQANAVQNSGIYQDDDVPAHENAVQNLEVYQDDEVPARDNAVQNLEVYQDDEVPGRANRVQNVGRCIVNEAEADKENRNLNVNRRANIEFTAIPFTPPVRRKRPVGRRLDFDNIVEEKDLQDRSDEWVPNESEHNEAAPEEGRISDMPEMEYMNTMDELLNLELLAQVNAMGNRVNFAYAEVPSENRPFDIEEHPELSWGENLNHLPRSPEETPVEIDYEPVPPDPNLTPALFQFEQEVYEALLNRPRHLNMEEIAVIGDDVAGVRDEDWLAFILRKILRRDMNRGIIERLYPVYLKNKRRNEAKLAAGMELSPPPGRVVPRMTMEEAEELYRRRHGIGQEQVGPAGEADVRELENIEAANEMGTPGWEDDASFYTDVDGDESLQYMQSMTDSELDNYEAAPEDSGIFQLLLMGDIAELDTIDEERNCQFVEQVYAMGNLKKFKYAEFPSENIPFGNEENPELSWHENLNPLPRSPEETPVEIDYEPVPPDPNLTPALFKFEQEAYQALLNRPRRLNSEEIAVIGDDVAGERDEDWLAFILRKILRRDMNRGIIERLYPVYLKNKRRNQAKLAAGMELSPPPGRVVPHMTMEEAEELYRRRHGIGQGQAILQQVEENVGPAGEADVRELENIEAANEMGTLGSEGQAAYEERGLSRMPMMGEIAELDSIDEELNADLVDQVEAMGNRVDFSYAELPSENRPFDIEENPELPWDENLNPLTRSTEETPVEIDYEPVPPDPNLTPLLFQFEQEVYEALLNRPRRLNMEEIAVIGDDVAGERDEDWLAFILRKILRRDINRGIIERLYPVYLKNKRRNEAKLAAGMELSPPPGRVVPIMTMEQAEELYRRRHGIGQEQANLQEIEENVRPAGEADVRELENNEAANEMGTLGPQRDATFNIEVFSDEDSSHQNISYVDSQTSQNLPEIEADVEVISDISLTLVDNLGTSEESGEYNDFIDFSENEGSVPYYDRTHEASKARRRATAPGRLGNASPNLPPGRIQSTPLRPGGVRRCAAGAFGNLSRIQRPDATQNLGRGRVQSTPQRTVCEQRGASFGNLSPIRTPGRNVSNAAVIRQSTPLRDSFGSGIDNISPITFGVPANATPVPRNSS